jgi:adenylate kinase
MTEKPESPLNIQSAQNKYRSILIFGPPGSGKGTIGRFLSSAGSHFHLSSGDIFRGLSPESPAGKLFHQYASKGLLLPDSITVDIWNYYVGGLIATNKYHPGQQLLLLDGIPRTLNQAALLESYVDIKHVIVLDLDDQDELLRRMQRRAKIEGRHDDSNIDVLTTRMEIYRKETAQVLSQYPEELISRFNAQQKPLEVLRDILARLCHILSPGPIPGHPIS